MGERQAVSFVVDESTGRPMSLPFSNTAPDRTRATRCGAFTAKGYAHIGPAKYPSWLQELVAQQQELIKLD